MRVNGFLPVFAQIVVFTFFSQNEEMLRGLGQGLFPLMFVSPYNEKIHDEAAVLVFLKMRVAQRGAAERPAR